MTFQRKFSLQKVDDFLASDAADSFTQIFGEFFDIKKFIFDFKSHWKDHLKIFHPWLISLSLSLSLSLTI